MVTPGPYCVVFDTVVEDLPKELSFDRPWDPGANPKTAVNAWMGAQSDFEIDLSWDAKLAVTVAASYADPDGGRH